MSDCTECKWLLRGITCEAYPEGIPMPILSGATPHLRNLPGDNGYLFTPADPDPEKDADAEA